jgi:hypothetical protein
MDVVWMSKGDFRERTPREEGRINPMQGRSPGREPTDPLFYPGDMEIHGDRVQLQVHLIWMRSTDASSSVKTSALALYIPRDDPRYDLRYVVRDEAQ